MIRAGRQVEKTTFLVNTILYTAVSRPGVHIVLVCPRGEQGGVFSDPCLLPTIQASPLIRRALLGDSSLCPPVKTLHFRTGRSSTSARLIRNAEDTARGIDADMLVVDEFQDIAAGVLPVLEQGLSHSDLRRVVLVGTPKTVDNHLEGVFGQSTAAEFQVSCPGLLVQRAAR